MIESDRNVSRRSAGEIAEYSLTIITEKGINVLLKYGMNGRSPQIEGWCTHERWTHILLGFDAPTADFPTVVMPNIRGRRHQSSRIGAIRFVGVRSNAEVLGYRPAEAPAGGYRYSLLAATRKPTPLRHPPERPPAGDDGGAEAQFA